MFGKKKEPKKQVFTCEAVHHNGLPNFLIDFSCTITVDEPNGCIIFSEGTKKQTGGKTATLDFSKIISAESGERGNAVKEGATGGAIIGGMLAGTTGAVIGSTAGKQITGIPTLKITYQSGDEEKQINLYRVTSVVKLLIDKNLREIRSEVTHVEL